MSDNNTVTESKDGLLNRILNKVEVVGNKLPDPAVMFAGLLVIIWVLSLIFSQFSFSEQHPLTGEQLQVNNLLAPDAIAEFLASMVTTFMHFAPLGVVLVAMILIEPSPQSSQLG